MTAFRKIFIEITNRCNLHCPFCAPGLRPALFMEPDVFAAILARIRGATDHLCLHVLGEPLLHPRLAAILAHCGEAEKQVNLTTNGTLLGERRALLLAAPAIRQISISLQALLPLEETRARAHLEEIVDFSLEAGRTGKYVSLRLWVLGAGPSTVDRNRLKGMLDMLATVFPSAPPRLDLLCAGKGIPLATRVFLNPEKAFCWPHPDDPELGSQGYCRGLRDHLAILADGTVVPCCLDSEGRLALGNILAQPLAAILASERAGRMMAGFAAQRLCEPLCRRCTYRLRFASTGTGWDFSAEQILWP